MATSEVGVPTTESPTLNLGFTDLPSELKREILEYFFIDKRVSCARRRPPPKGKAKKLKPLSKFRSPLISVLLVSKNFVDKDAAVKAMLTIATSVLKRAHFDDIDHFLDQHRRHLVERLELD